MPGTQLDMGDAPDPVSTTSGRYPTSLVNNGARHVSNATSLRLGSAISSELDAKPTPLADGDDGDDGVTFQFQRLNKPMFNRNIDTQITMTLSAPGYVDGWIDFNADGDWDDAGEHVVPNLEFTTNTLTQTINVRVPTTSPVPVNGLDSFARFRTSTAGSMLPTGLALDGEVEDYLVRIVPGVPPVDTYTMDEDQSGGLVTVDANGLLTPGFVVDDGVLANDLSPDGRVLSAQLLSGPSFATNTPFALGQNGLFNYLPTQDFFGQDSMVYRAYVVLDAARGEILEALSDTTVTINVRPVNDAPTATGFSQTIDEDSTLRLTESQIINLSNASAGPANESGQTLRVTVPNNVTSQSGSVSVVGGVLTYTPRPDFSGVDTFAFTITDDGITGTLPDPRSVTRTMTVTVRDKNDPPVTVTKFVTIDEDTSYQNVISFFTAGDSPVEPGQILSFTGVVPQSTQGGTVVIVAGQIIYTPPADFNGTDTFFYLVTDDGFSEGQPDPQTSRGTVSVTINPVNDAPRKVKDFELLAMAEDDAERSLNLTQYFTDPDVILNGDILTYSVVSNNNNNLVQINFVGNTMFVRPLPDANGSARVVVEAKDSAGLTVTNVLNIEISPVDDTPRLVNPLPNLNVNEDQVIAPITLTPTYFFDPDVASNNDVLTFSVQVGNPDLVTAAIVNGQLQLTLRPNASGFSTVTVTATDTTNRSVSDSFDLVVAAVNDGPISVDDSYTVPQGARFQTTDPRGVLTPSRNDDGVLANDSDPEGNAFTARLAGTAARFGTVTMNPDGTFVYQSNAGTPIGTVDTFQYEAVDQFGAVGNRATVRLTVGNPPPPTHQNPANRLDVNADGNISPLDVLLIVNFLNFAGSPSVPVTSLEAPPPYRDVNGNNFVDPLDVLDVVNYLNARSNQNGEGEGESSQTMMVGVSLLSENSLRWSSEVQRDSSNVGVPMGPSQVANALASGQNKRTDLSLADYLASIDEHEPTDEIATVLAADYSPDDDPLDAFFADIG
jgi:hypothetical protein